MKQLISFRTACPHLGERVLYYFSGTEFSLFLLLSPRLQALATGKTEHLFLEPMSEKCKDLEMDQLVTTLYL